MRPRDGASATRLDLLAGGPIEVPSESVELDARSASERRDDGVGAYKAMPPQRKKLADRDAIPGHNEGFALVKLAHNLAAVIAKFPLSDLSCHNPNCSTSATPVTSPIISNGQTVAAQAAGNGVGL
jgi:hypothetical protein